MYSVDSESEESISSKSVGSATLSSEMRLFSNVDEILEELKRRVSSATITELAMDEWTSDCLFTVDSLSQEDVDMDCFKGDGKLLSELRVFEYDAGAYAEEDSDGEEGDESDDNDEDNNIVTRSSAYIDLQNEILRERIRTKRAKISSLKADDMSLDMALGRMKHEKLINSKWVDNERERKKFLEELVSDDGHQDDDENVVDGDSGDHDVTSHHNDGEEHEYSLAKALELIHKVKSHHQKQLARLNALLLRLHQEEEELRKQELEGAHMNEVNGMRMDSERGWRDESKRIEKCVSKEHKELASHVHSLKEQSTSLKKEIQFVSEEEKLATETLKKIIRVLKGKEYQLISDGTITVKDAIRLHGRFQAAAEKGEVNRTWLRNFLTKYPQFGAQLPYPDFTPLVPSTSRKPEHDADSQSESSSPAESTTSSDDLLESDSTSPNHASLTEVVESRQSENLKRYRRLLEEYRVDDEGSDQTHRDENPKQQETSPSSQSR